MLDCSVEDMICLKLWVPETSFWGFRTCSFFKSIDFISPLRDDQSLWSNRVKQVGAKLGQAQPELELEDGI